MLYDTFCAFGGVITAKVMCDPDNGKSKGFGFVAFDSFESSDTAIAAMSGQYLCGQQINVQYAFKKDGSQGERHGSAAERLLAASAIQFGIKPHTRFAADNDGSGNGGSQQLMPNVPAAPQFPYSNPMMPNPMMPNPMMTNPMMANPMMASGLVPPPMMGMPGFPQMYAPPPMPYFQPPPMPRI